MTDAFVTNYLYDQVFNSCLEEDAAEAAHDDPRQQTIMSGNELRIARDVRRLAVAAYLAHVTTTVPTCTAA